MAGAPMERCGHLRRPATPGALAAQTRDGALAANWTWAWRAPVLYAYRPFPESQRGLRPDLHGALPLRGAGHLQSHHGRVTGRKQKESGFARC